VSDVPTQEAESETIEERTTEARDKDVPAILTDEKAKRKLDFKTVWREAREIVWQYRGRLLLGLLLIFVSRGAGFVLPASTKYLVDDVIGKGRTELLYTLALAAGIATLVQAATSFLISQILGIAAQRAITEMRKDVEQHVMRLPIRFFDSTKSGILISRVMTDAEGLRNLVGTGLVQLTGGLITAFFALGVLFYLNWRLTSVTLVALLTFGAMMAIAFSRLRPIFRERNEIHSQTTGRLTEALGGVRIVKAYTAEKREDRLFAHNIHAFFRNVAKSITAISGVSAASTLLFGGIGVLMMVFGGRAILAGEMTLGDMVMYVFFTGLVATPMIQISSIATQLSEAFAGLDRIRELRNLPTEADGDDRRERVRQVEGEIEFRDVSFEYVPGQRVLKNVSFVAPPGTTTALVGSSGSGKSTLISLVMTFNRPLEGRVLVDGHDLADLRLYDYRRLLGIVLQDNFLFDGTIGENIAYGNPGATDEKILWAGQIAHCEPFVENFPDGYDTVVGERGVKLSGGQRQRIAIARAILADPKILILDEATSSLDSESEAMIQDGLKHLRTGRTSFVIAHRLSTIQSADQILVLEDGEIVERGTHEELLAKEGRYRELYDRQYKLELNRFVNPGEDFTPEPEKDTVEARAPSNRSL